MDMRDFSNRDAFTNVNEALVTLDNARKVYEPLASSKLRHQQRSEAYDASQLGQIQVGQIKKAIAANPDLQKNLMTAQNLKAQADILEIPVQGQARIAEAVLKKAQASSNLEQLPVENRMRRLSNANMTASAPFLPNAVNDLPDADVDAFLTSSYDPTQSSVPVEEYLKGTPMEVKRQRLREMGSERLARRGLFPDLSQAVAAAGPTGQVSPDKATGLFQVLPPIPVSKDDLIPGRNQQGQPTFFQSTRSGLRPVAGATPIVPASAMGPRTKMDYDPALGQNRLAIIDENGNRIGWAGGDNITGAEAEQPKTLEVPMKVPNPFLGLNPKTEQLQRAKLYNEGSTKIEKEYELAGVTKQIADRARTFKKLNATNLTGPGTGLLGLRRFDPGYVTMDSAAQFIVPKMREKGSGSTSNFDAGRFERATIGVDKPKEANDAIADAVVAQAERDQAKAIFLETYLNAHGHIAGAEQHWARYINAHTIFDLNSTDEMPRLNPNIIPWQTFFTGENTGQQPAAAPTAGQMPEINSDAEYASLPANSDFISGGKVYHKP